MPPNPWTFSKSVGGLGHVAIQYAAKFGYTVVAISRGSDKKDQCLELGVRVSLGEDVHFLPWSSCDLGVSGMIVQLNEEVHGIST